MRRKFEIVTRIGKSGRIVIPAEIRRALDLDVGDELILVLDEEGLRILSRSQAIRRAQSLVRRRVPKGRRLAAELIEERREET